MPREFKGSHPRVVIDFLHNLYLHRGYDATGVDPLINEFNEKLGYEGRIREHGVGYDIMFRFNELFRDLNGIGTEGPGLSAGEKVKAREYLNSVVERVDGLLLKHASEVIELSEIEARIVRDQKAAATLRAKLGIER